MNLRFSKYHGAGNDFIMVDIRNNEDLNLSAETISNLCDRHFGIGADGLIILNESEDYDFRMDYYNSDGLPGSMCGNGGRCTMAFAMLNGWASEKCTFEASDGAHQAFALSDGRIKLELKPVIHVSEVSSGYYLNTGSPHLVIFIEDIDTMDVYTIGRKHRYDNAYPSGTNVNFVEFQEDGIKVRTYERGVEAETLSCGTGVTASALAAFQKRITLGNSVKVQTLGGMLQVDFKHVMDENKFTDIFLTGPVERVFDGNVEI